MQLVLGPHLENAKPNVLLVCHGSESVTLDVQCLGSALGDHTLDDDTGHDFWGPSEWPKVIYCPVSPLRRRLERFGLLFAKSPSCSAPVFCSRAPFPPSLHVQLAGSQAAGALCGGERKSPFLQKAPSPACTGQLRPESKGWWGRGGGVSLHLDGFYVSEDVLWK